MTDENNPTIYVEYSDEEIPDLVWDSLLTHALEFHVSNSGILKAPEATLKLRNKNGIYTGNGTLTLKQNKYLRIRADVRGTIDQLFFGKIIDLMSENKSKNEQLTIKARGLVGHKLLKETITKDYGTEQTEKAADRNMKEVIEHFLATPDTGINTNITLTTDSGAITTTKAKHDFNRTYLADAIRDICEFIEYTGYEDVEGSSYTPKLYLHPYGTNATSPAITIPINDADIKNILEQEWSKGDLDTVANHLFLWGLNISGAYPNGDYCTEGGYGLGYWTPLNGECTVSDDTTNATVNSKCIKIVKASGSLDDMGATCVFPDTIDMKAKGLTMLCFALKTTVEDLFLQIDLYDINNREISWAQSIKLTEQKWDDDWVLFFIPIGAIYRESLAHRAWRLRDKPIEPIEGKDEWRGDTAFSWQGIKKIKIHTLHIDPSQTCTWYIDGLHFEGNIIANPIIDSALQITNSDSIAEWGRSPAHLDVENIRHYIFLQQFGEKVIKHTKDPIPKLTVKYGAKTWAKPNQYITVNFPCYGISNEQWRIVEISFDWKTLTKNLRSTFQLTPRTQPVTSREWYAGQVAGILKDIEW